jgi:hypothetical protein
MSAPVPFKPETWPVDADGHESNLCTICGTPVRYGSRHSRCARPEDFKPMNNPIPSQEATAERVWSLVERYADSVCDYNTAVRIDVGINKAGAECLAIEKELRAALRPPTPAADQQTERRALGELVEADTALQAWCTAKRAEPKAPFDPMASMSSAGFTFKKEPEHDAIIARLNKAWDSARAACFAGGSPARDVEAPAAINQGSDGGLIEGEGV